MPLRRVDAPNADHMAVPVRHVDQAELAQLTPPIRLMQPLADQRRATARRAVRTPTARTLRRSSAPGSQRYRACSGLRRPSWVPFAQGSAGIGLQGRNAVHAALQERSDPGFALCNRRPRAWYGGRRCASAGGDAFCVRARRNEHVNQNRRQDPLSGRVVLVAGGFVRWGGLGPGRWRTDSRTRCRPLWGLASTRCVVRRRPRTFGVT